MYGRMILLMVISLYTSRVVLEALGIKDYGIYNVVGSIVVMFNSLRTVFSSSIQRFLNYEIGKGNISQLKKIFNLSLQVNSIVACLFILLVESVGVWFVSCKMNVDPERIIATHYVLQFSLLSAVVSIFTTTFDAEIIAHERMDFYAYMSVFDAAVRLGVVFIVSNFAGDKLILYGFLHLICTILTFCCNGLFCRKNFEEIRFAKVKDNDYLKKMLTFAGWNFFGNTAYAVSQNGLNMVLNVFGGPVVNAARGIAYQMNSALLQVINNVGIVIKPYVIQSYAKEDTTKTYNAIFMSSKLFFILQLCIVIFFSFLAEDVIRIWLGQVPEYVVIFLIIVLWQSLIRALHGPIDLFFYANGQLKQYQLCEGILLLMPVGVSYLLLKIGMPFYSAFIVVCVFELINMVAIVMIAKKYCKFPILPYLNRVVKPCLLMLMPYILIFIYFLTVVETSSLLDKIIMELVIYVLTIIIALFMGLSKDERNILISVFKKK